MSAAKAVTDATFNAEVLKNDKPILVDFWAEWCPPCRAVGPILDEIAAERADKIDVVKLNVDENPATAAKYRIASIPALIMFHDGKVVKSMLGAMPKSVLETELADYLA